MTIYRINKEKNGLELVFDKIPSFQVRESLKKSGWRWSKFGGFWYNKNTPLNETTAKLLAGGQVLETPAQAPAQIQPKKSNSDGETMKKITLAGLKSFIRKHKENLFIKVKSDFDGMTDGIEPVEMNWRKVDPESIDFSNEYTLGIAGVWLVGSSRDRISISTAGDFISVYNCCGHWCLSLTND